MAQGFDKQLVNNEKKFVKFDHNCSPYLAGEVGLFPIMASIKLTNGANPIGHYVKRDGDGKWVPDKGEENGNDEQADQNGSDKQAGTGETGGEALQAATPRKAGQQRRSRAKL